MIRYACSGNMEHLPMNKNVLSLAGSAYEKIKERDGLVAAVNRFVQDLGYLPSDVAESEVAGELRDDPGLSEEARNLL